MKHNHITIPQKNHLGSISRNSDQSSLRYGRRAGPTRFSFVVSVLAVAIAVSGCAANMAATGRNGPDLNVVSREASRQDIERQLGSPIQTRQLGNGEYMAIYDVEPRTKPNMARAAGHGTLDLFTFGLWEVVGGPLEAANARRVLVSVRYDGNDRPMELTSKVKPIL